MQKPDLLIRTKLRLPLTRPGLVLRPRLQEKITLGLGGPLTLVAAPAGFGKTTLVASCVRGCDMPVAWLSLDKDDNQIERFLSYLVAALQEADHTIGKEAARVMTTSQQAPSEVVLTSLINDLDTFSGEIVLVLDDYQYISGQAIHDGLAFVLEHCPNSFHMVIVTRSDPPLPLARLRARGYLVELRAADLRFTGPETDQYLNGVMGLRLDDRAVTALEERTEGWITGLQMAALSMRDRQDVSGFIEGFSGTNRYILDYLLEEVLASQPPDIQHFLLHTSILERLSAPLCDAVLEKDGESNREDGDRLAGAEARSPGQSASILEYLEKANLFLVPLDDERIWYRYHHLFSDLLLARLQKSSGAHGVAQLHVRASEWHGQNGSVLEAIHHASLAADDARLERYIEQNYLELVSHGEQSGVRTWISKLNRELVYSRPWLCIYEAYSHSWFGELDEADRLLDEAEKRIQSEGPIPDAPAMLVHITYVRSRVTAMRGDLQRAIELCLVVRENVPDDNLALYFDSRITLGYEYFLYGDYANASLVLNELIQSGTAVGAVINTVAAACILARMYGNQGLLDKAYDLYQTAAQFIMEVSEQHRDVRALVEVGVADVLYEWNDLEAALAHVKQGLALMPWWGKADDFALAYITLSRIHLAQANKKEAAEAVEKAIQFVQTKGVFSEARQAAEIAQVKLWLAQGDLQSARRWAELQEKRAWLDDQFGLGCELVQITRARVFIAQNRLKEVIDILSPIEETARNYGRMGRVIEILLLEALARCGMGDGEQAARVLTKCLTLAEPRGYVRLFLDEGGPMQMLLTRWLAQNGDSPVRDYALHLLAQFDAEPIVMTEAQERASPAAGLVEPLTPRELQVLCLISRGCSNREVANQLFLAEGTVKYYVHAVLEKLEVHNRTQAIAKARELNLI